MTNLDDFEEEDFDQIEFQKISEIRQRSTQIALQRFIDQNKDDRTKHVGDNVLIWDCSRLTNNETGKIEYDDTIQKLLSNYPSIVIETGCKYTAEIKTFTGDFSKNLDLKVWNKNLNKVYRTSSDFVKLHNVR